MNRTDTCSKKSSRTTGYVCLLITFTLWGSLYVVSKYVLGKMPTFTISFLRFTLAFLALTISGKKDTVKMERQDYKYILLIGAVGYFVAVGAQLLGTKYAGASMASLINSLNPVTMTLFAALLLHEAMTLRKVAGILLAICGVYAIIGAGGADVNVPGVCLSLFSVLLWSFVSVMTRKLAQKYGSIQVTRYGAGVAAICYLPVCLGEIVRGEPVQFDISCVLSLLYMGVVCTGVAYFLWNKSLSILEAGTCSAFYPVQPLVSTILGIVLLHETVGVSFLVGAALIVAGVLINLSSKT